MPSDDSLKNQSLSIYVNQKVVLLGSGMEHFAGGCSPIQKE